MDGVEQATIETKKENPGARVANQATSLVFPQLHTLSAHLSISNAVQDDARQGPHLV